MHGVNPSQQLVKIVHDELVLLLGKEVKPLDFSGHPNLIMMLGLQGSGKTTFSGKLALNCRTKRGRKVLLVAGDVYRPAAIDQLKVLGEQIGVEVYTEEGSKDPVSIAKNAVAKAKNEGFSLVIVDTAGRLAVDEEMMKEMKEWYDGGDPTNACSWTEYYKCLGPLDI